MLKIFHTSFAFVVPIALAVVFTKRLQNETESAVNSTVGHPNGFDCAIVPPALWCADNTIRTLCGTDQLCARHDNAVHFRPMHLTLLYESLCPYSQAFIKDTLFEVYTRFQYELKIELVPYGNAWTSDNNQTLCQHGSEECRNNKFQSCVIHYLPDPMPMVYCLESLLGERVNFEKTTKLCFNLLQTADSVRDRIEHCSNGTEGDELQRMAARKTESVWPDKHKYVPWIVVNDVSIEATQFFQNALPALICASRARDEYFPMECGQI